MSSNLIKICYESESGNCDIRTCYVGDIIHISLRDILYTLNRENREIDPSHLPKTMTNIIRAQIKDMDNEEYISLPASKPTFPEETEVFVTQPGLYRVLSTDKSKAGKKFQKWLFHEVIPSLTKYGIYPPPATNKGSAISQMAEILAQNSRLLADTIAKQEELAHDVTIVKNQIGNVNSRLNLLEEKNPIISNLKSINDFILMKGIELEDNQKYEIFSWCENITLKHKRDCHKSHTDKYEDYMYTEQTLEEAIQYQFHLKNIQGDL